MNPKGVLITKTVGVISAAFVCLAILATPVGASVMLRGGMAGFGVTDPGALTSLGAILVSMGVLARRALSRRRIVRRAA